MIKDDQDEQQNHQGPTDEYGEKLKYYPIAEDYALKTYTPILFGTSGRIATEADIADGRNRLIELGDLLQTATYKLRDLGLKENDLKAKIAVATSRTGKPALRTKLVNVERKITTETATINNIKRDIERVEQVKLLLEKNIEENEVKKSEVIT